MLIKDKSQLTILLHLLILTVILAAIEAASSLDHNAMVYNLFGGDGINIEIPKDVFPTKSELEEMDSKLPGVEHGWFESSYENLRLHYVKFVPKAEVKGVVVFCHGVGSNCVKGTIIGDRKLSGALLVDSFQKNGIAFYSFDYLGHGFSEGTRFFIPDWKANKQDVINFCNLVADKHPPNIPFFLAGESYGGTLTIHVAKEFQDHPEKGPKNFDSILLTAPAIIGDLPGFPKYQILRYVLAPLFPKWTPFFMPHPISPDRIWRHEDVLKERTEKRYLEMGIDGSGLPFRLGTALNLVVALDEVRNKVIPSLKVPFCSVHGTSDYGVPLEGSRFLMEKSKTATQDKELHEIEGAYHDVFSDPLAEESIGYWMKFVQSRLEKISG